ncbi:MAG: HAMP domain-containing histidine kinase, partial [Burkholderiaceae bacterium]|nr:HAMP domain-containing histidine kinase [Burkholderiaceae bacterium]
GCSVAAAMRVLSQWRALPAADVGDALDQQYRSVSRLTTMEAAAAAAVQVDRIQTSLVAHSAREAKVALGALLALLLVLGLIAAVIVVDVLRPLRRWALELVRRPPQATTRELVPDHVVEFAILGDALEARRDQVAQALSQLEVANRELAQIVHSLSHDLRSPLITVAGFTGVVRRELIGAHTPDVARALDDISEATRTMERLLARVLDWARAGRITLRPEPVSIAELTREATRSLAARIDATGTAVSLAGEDLLVWGDSVGLASVLRNLLDNAIACAGAEGQAPRVFVRASDAGATQCIEVSDNGPGINASARARIFEPFERFGRDTEGVGLGLTITRRYVERHGGSIEVLAGEGGKGARFRVLLPARGSPGAIARGGDADPAP